MDIEGKKSCLTKNHINNLISCFELSIISAFFQGMSLLGCSEKHLKSKIEPSQVISLWMNKSVLRGNLLKENSKFNQDIYLSQNFALCKSFIKKVENFQFESEQIFKECPWILSICPCLISGINFIFNTDSKINISQTINTQRNIFGGHLIFSE